MQVGGDIYTILYIEIWKDKPIISRSYQLMNQINTNKQELKWLMNISRYYKKYIKEHIKDQTKLKTKEKAKKTLFKMTKFYTNPM